MYFDNALPAYSVRQSCDEPSDDYHNGLLENYGSKALFTGYQFWCKKDIGLGIVTSSLSQGLAKPFTCAH
jgi:hypothetical protein